MRLDECFRGDGLPRAFDSYERFAERSKWKVSHKIDLYRRAHKAYSDRHPGEGNCEHFKTIYSLLAGQWQVFRPCGPDRRWPDQQLFNVLCASFKDFWPGKMTLLQFDLHRHGHQLVTALQCIRELKQMSSYPLMAASKFLHFFNPSLFPIYDGAVMEQRVFRIFDSEYGAFCSERKLNCRAKGEHFYPNYLAFAKHLLQPKHGELMEQFEGRFGRADKAACELLATCHATAAEFIMIGAAYHVDPW